MDVTPQMTSKWVKAAFLILLGLVLLVYSGGLVDDFERNSSEEFNLSFEWTWELVRILLWILIAWLFVDAVLIIALSFKADLYTLNDAMVRLNAIEKKVDSLRQRTPAKRVVVESPPVSDMDFSEGTIDQGAPEFQEPESDEPPPPVE